MTNMEYAKEVAALVNGTAKEVEKANGVKLAGVTIRTEGSNISPCIYVDIMNEEGLTPEEAAEEVKRLTVKSQRENIDIDRINDFETIKPMLRARLYNEKTSAEVKRSAASYGFNDLIIVPYIEGIIENGSCKVTEALLNAWNATAEEVIDIAEENSRAEANMKSLHEVLCEMMGAAAIPEDHTVPTTLVISNDRRMYGAYGVIAKLDDLKVRFTNGFTVIPSSVHECLVIDADDPTFDSMVQEVNAAEVNLEEQLSNHAYRIAA